MITKNIKQKLPMKKYVKTFEEFLVENYLHESIDVNKIFAEHAKDELVNTSADEAYQIAVDMLGDEDAKKVFGEKEDFTKKYDEAQKSAETNGKYKRGQMPVINNSNFKGAGKGKEDEESAPRRKEVEEVLDEADVKDNIKDAVLSNQVVAFKFLVGNGFIDISGDDKELAKKTQEDLYKDDALAKNWLSSGKGPKENVDKIKGDYADVPVNQLKPIQEQIFVAKSIKMTSKCGGDLEKMNWLLKPDEKSPYTIISKDNFILDGHHRWLCAYMINPETVMKCVKIDMNCKDLLELTNKFTGAIGNKPNVTA